MNTESIYDFLSQKTASDQKNILSKISEISEITHLMLHSSIELSSPMNNIISHLLIPVTNNVPDQYPYVQALAKVLVTLHNKDFLHLLPIQDVNKEFQDNYVDMPEIWDSNSSIILPIDLSKKPKSFILEKFIIVQSQNGTMNFPIISEKHLINMKALKKNATPLLKYKHLDVWLDESGEIKKVIFIVGNYVMVAEFISHSDFQKKSDENELLPSIAFRMHTNIKHINATPLYLQVVENG